jgi:hypothetical protein
VDGRQSFASAVSIWPLIRDESFLLATKALAQKDATRVEDTIDILRVAAANNSALLPVVVDCRSIARKVGLSHPSSRFLS